MKETENRLRSTLTDEPLLSLRWIDPVTGARGYLVFDTVVRGVTAGGCRMRPGLTEEEVFRLARVMTLKFALFGVTAGGAKCGLDYDPSRPDAPEVLARFFQAIRPFFLETFITGEDLGTSQALIVETLQRVGIGTTAQAAVRQWGIGPEVVGAIAEALRLDIEGLPLESIIAGYGVSQCTLEALDHIGLPPSEARVSVQGFGSVGGATARYLHQAGARIVAIADIAGTVADPEGLDVPHLLAHRRSLGVMDRGALPEGCRLLDSTGWLTEPSDVLIPAAISDAIGLRKAEWVNARIVVEGANLPLSEEAERYLHERGVIVLPDFLANSAFAFAYGAMLMGLVSANADAILHLVSGRLREVTRQVLEGFERGVLPRQRATQIAEENLKSFE